MTPKFAIADAVRFARDIYGLGVAASMLPSERDQNFALETAAGEKYVLKIANADEDRSVLGLQNAALAHVARRAPGLALARLIPTFSGEELATILRRANRISCGS